MMPPTPQLIIPGNLASTIQTLSTSLKTIQPISSDPPTTQLITYALVATVIAGLVVYHYIKNHEAND